MIRGGLGEAQEAYGLLEEELPVHEGLEGDVEPADAAFAINEVGAVERDVLEVVVGAPALEELEFRVRCEGEGVGVLSFL